MTLQVTVNAVLAGDALNLAQIRVYGTPQSPPPPQVAAQTTTWVYAGCFNDNYANVHTGSPVTGRVIPLIYNSGSYGNTLNVCQVPTHDSPQPPLPLLPVPSSPSGPPPPVAHTR